MATVSKSLIFGGIKGGCFFRFVTYITGNTQNQKESARLSGLSCGSNLF